MPQHTSRTYNHWGSFQHRSICTRNIALLWSVLRTSYSRPTSTPNLHKAAKRAIFAAVANLHACARVRAPSGFWRHFPRRGNYLCPRRVSTRKERASGWGKEENFCLPSSLVVVTVCVLAGVDGENANDQCRRVCGAR